MDLVLAVLLASSTLLPLALIWLAPAQETQVQLYDWKERYLIDDQIIPIYASASLPVDRAA
jgi:hypothetical protein